ncbi:hypothetical protein [Sphingobium nicotianae]|uniref:Uncharacterized protein n=1 Tax=Sphingobium nicotianae TaxID=2782607 RepID=A0A9X1ITK8_9SPHN|nr:hypothetical protein [Sphingobium nicotianae]MBT2189314.1 hypothetical protein [Sphingobium nicotianae]
MILLSALLASLTGLVSGERPAERAQVELSAVAAVVETGQAAAIARVRRPALPAPAFGAVLLLGVLALIVAPARSGRALLCLKQSWRH